MSKIQSVRGMNDVLPGEARYWQLIESSVVDVLESYGYQEVRFPLVEKTGLFKRAIGEVTDIVEKEMYTFEDKGGESLTLRPEGTACCVRLCEQHGLLHNQLQKLWYMGPMFRYERPQKGRMRQFHQVGVEAFGFPDPDIEAEMLLLTNRIWKALGLDASVQLQINSLGSVLSRNAYRSALVSYLTEHVNELDQDSRRRMGTNPLRILDSKDKNTQRVLDGAPVFSEYLDEVSLKSFDCLCRTLQYSGVQYKINNRLVRGLDYYTGTVFEWVTTDLGSQGTVCAGGRYDGLVEQLGGKKTPAFGFAMGLERLVLLSLAEQSVGHGAQADIFFIVDENMSDVALKLAEGCRDSLSGLVISVALGGGSFKSQFKRADKSGAQYAVVVGEQESCADEVLVKSLRDGGAQHTVKFEALSQFLKTNILT